MIGWFQLTWGCMSAVLQRLQSVTDKTPIIWRDTWVFRDELEKKETSFFQPLVRIHHLLKFEYDVHCIHLAHTFNHKGSKNCRLSEAELIILVKQVEAALAMAELLTHIYFYYLDVPREVLLLQTQQKYYRSLLRMCGCQFPNISKLETEPTDSLSHTIRETTLGYNWHRLFTIRIRRVFITLLPFLQNWQKFSNAINFIDWFLGPTLNYVAWVFYLPRLTTNLVLLFKHLFPNKWTGMADKEEQLHWLVRLETQLQRRWFHLGNDTAWFVSGVLSCFVLVGSLAPTGWYLTVAVFLFDVILASIRAVIELHQINRCVKSIRELVILNLGIEQAEKNLLR